MHLRDGGDTVASMLQPIAKIVLVAVASAAGADCALAVRPSAGCDLQSPPPETGEHRSKIGSVNREWVLDVPENIESGKPIPLLFVFHGLGHSGAGIREVLPLRRLAEREKFLAVYPTGLPVTLVIRGRPHTAPGWQLEPGGNRDVELTKAILAEVAATACVDLDRVYATGFSNGAFFSNLLGCEMADVFAAIAPVGGGGYRGACKPVAPVAVMIHHGLRDTVVPIAMARASRDQWIEANRCTATADSEGACNLYPDCRPGGEVVYCEEGVGHSWPPAATERIWRFLSGKSRDIGPRADPR